MDMITQGVSQGLQLLFHGDEEVIQILLFTLQVSGMATGISVLLGIPFGLWLALKEFQAKQTCSGLVNFGMGLPPVVVGLVVSLFLWRYGPLGALGLMYTPMAMIMAQAIIATPIVAGLSFSAILSVNPKLRWQLISLGATPLASKLAISTGGAFRFNGCRHRWVWAGYLRSRGIHDGGWEY